MVGIQNKHTITPSQKDRHFDHLSYCAITSSLLHITHHNIEKQLRYNTKRKLQICIELFNKIWIIDKGKIPFKITSNFKRGVFLLLWHSIRQYQIMHIVKYPRSKFPQIPNFQIQVNRFQFLTILFSFFFVFFYFFSIQWIIKKRSRKNEYWKGNNSQTEQCLLTCQQQLL